MNPVQSKKLVRRVATVLMMSAAPFLAAEHARAQAACTPATSAGAPVINGMVTCTGGSITQNGTAGYGTGAEGENQIAVQSSATVTGAAQGFLLGDLNTITNNGTVEATGTNGIAIEAQTAGASINISNFGTTRAAESGGTAIKADQVLLSNAATGTISAFGVAVDGRGLGGSSVSMGPGGRGNFGLIEATGVGGIAIRSAADANIINSGTIQANGSQGTAIQ
ncbi:MAG TPA: hypothetical protein VFP60_17005, partial [Pseudolabrys sp.]|nr:hypothetical protein [Pseudolabrys sp.]